MENKKLNKEFWKMTAGFIFSALTAPLLTSVDTAVVGQLYNPAYIGGVAIGGTIFNTLYWILGFLRVSTSGYSAKAYGLKNEKEEILVLIRPMIISIVIGILFLIFQNQIFNIATGFYKTTPEITKYMKIYYKILIWGAPLVLLNYTFLGWIMGRKQIRECVLLQIITNVVNIILDLLFVMVFHMNVAGVAYATLISKIVTTLVSMYIILKGKKNERFSVKKAIKKISILEVFNKEAMKEIGFVNIDLIIRTICLLAVTNLFMEKSSLSGEVILAANSVLFQIQYLMAAFFDGVGNTVSVFIGNSIGEKNKEKIKWTIKKSYEMCVVISIIIAILFMIFKVNILQLYTNNLEVINIAKAYSIWMVIYPLTVHIALIFYGLFAGATYVSPVRNSMIISLGIFILSYIVFIPLFKNHGLWLSFILYSFGRSFFLWIHTKRLKEKVYREIDYIIKNKKN